MKLRVSLEAEISSPGGKCKLKKGFCTTNSLFSSLVSCLSKLYYSQKIRGTHNHKVCQLLAMKLSDIFTT